MTGPPVVADAGPLISLARVGLLDLLRQLYGKVLVPVEVMEELQTTENRPGSRALLAATKEGWLTAVSLGKDLERESLSLALGPGEAAAIVFAERNAYRFLLLLQVKPQALLGEPATIPCSAQSEHGKPDGVLRQELADGHALSSLAREAAVLPGKRPDCERSRRLARRAGGLPEKRADSCPRSRSRAQAAELRRILPDFPSSWSDRQKISHLARQDALFWRKSPACEGIGEILQGFGGDFKKQDELPGDPPTSAARHQLLLQLAIGPPRIRFGDSTLRIYGFEFPGQDP